MSSPITQQVISYPTRQGLSTNFANVSTRAIQAWGHDPKNGQRGIMNEMLSTVLGGFLQPVEKPIKPVDVACPTGMCEFPLFNSLGVCVKMANITHKLKVEEAPANLESWVIAMQMENATREYRVSLGEPCNITSPSTMTLRTCTMTPNMSYAFSDDRDLMATKIYSFPLIYSMFKSDTFNNISDPGPVTWGAFEAFFHLCVQSFNVTVKGGQSRTEVAGATWAQPANHNNTPLGIECTQMDSQSAIACYPPAEDSAPGSPWIYLANPAKINSMNDADYFGASRVALDQVIDPIHFSAEGAFMYDPTDGSDNGWGIGSGFLQMVEALYNNGDVAFTEVKPMDPELQMKRFGVILENVATSITNT